MTLLVGFRQFTGLEDLVHLLGTPNGGISQRFRNRDSFSTLYFIIIQSSVWDVNAIHLLQAHCLCSQLHLVPFIRFMMSSFIFHRV